MPLTREPPPRLPRVRKRYRRSLGPALLYLNDLDQIINYLRRDGEVTIRAGNAVADDVDDLRHARPSDLEDVEILAPAYEVQVNVSRHNANVYTVYDGDGAKERVDGVAHLVNTFKSLRGHPVFGYWKARLLALCYAIIGGSPALPLVVMTNIPPLWLIPAWIALAAITFYFWTNSNANGVRIVPMDRGESRAIQSERRANARMMIASAIVSGGLGSAVTYLLTRST